MRSQGSHLITASLSKSKTSVLICDLSEHFAIVPFSLVSSQVKHPPLMAYATGGCWLQRRGARSLDKEVRPQPPGWPANETLKCVHMLRCLDLASAFHNDKILLTEALPTVGRKTGPIKGLWDDRPSDLRPSYCSPVISLSFFNCNALVLFCLFCILNKLNHSLDRWHYLP